MNGFPSPEQVRARFIWRQTEPTPERLTAIEIINERIAELVAQGWKRRDWRPTTPGSPFVKRQESHYGRYLDWDSTIVTTEWFDHPYRLIAPDGRSVFVSEPYGVEAEGIAHLAAMLGDGWNVRVLADMAIHYPGWTVAIWITKKAGAA